MDRLPEQEIRLDGRFRIRCPLLNTSDITRGNYTILTVTESGNHSFNNLVIFPCPFTHEIKRERVPFMNRHRYFPVLESKLLVGLQIIRLRTAVLGLMEVAPLSRIIDTIDYTGIVFGLERM
jgi:hypothetical protein